MKGMQQRLRDAMSNRGGRNEGAMGAREMAAARLAYAQLAAEKRKKEETGGWGRGPGTSPL